MSIQTFAAIDVGSYELAMKIYEFSGKGGMKQIDHIRHRIELGTDTYTTGKISHERVDELCKVLSEYADMMKTYKVSAYRACGTSAIRETENRMIILEQVKLRTGLKVEVLSNSEQRFLHYKSVASKGERFGKVIEKGTAIVDVGGGSIQISLFDKDSLVATQNIRLGILRMREMLVDIQPHTKDYEHLIEELVDNQLISFKHMYLKNREIKNIIVVDDYISFIMQKLSEDEKVDNTISKEQYMAFLDVLRMKTPEQIARYIGMPEENASLLTPSAILFKRILEITGAELLWAPGVGLADGIAYDYGQKNKLIQVQHDFEADIVACAGNMGKRYQANRERNLFLDKTAVTIYDSMKKVHGMGKRERVLLRIAALLNDCGKYISLESSAESGYNIIMATEMIGLSHQEREIVANIVKYNKADFRYYDEIARESQLDREAYLKIAKLTAMFRVADGVCRSQRQKVMDVKAALKEDTLLLTVTSDEDISLEKGFFQRKTRFFEEVFSIKPIIKQKRNLNRI
ncbi:MAG TPA: exopolyphosphatase [Lachnospiraceae bacterium]|nr:exopolyphosphatase [Lachnospiraceae bacterium]